MVSHAPPRMQWALASAKRFECGSLLPLCFDAQTTCLSPYGPIRSRHASQSFLTRRRGCSGRWQARSAWSAAACCRFVSVPKQRVCPHTAPFGLATHPNGFSCAAADAVGVGKREALGVRQLAAALFLCPNNVPVTLFAPPNMVSVTIFAPRTSTTRHDQVSMLKPLVIRRLLEDGISPNSGSRTSVRPEHQEV